jgi:SAM-dependent methyltransferase
MAITKKIQTKFAEFRRADRKFHWAYEQWRWRFFSFRHRKQARLNFVFDRERGIETAAEVMLEAVGVSDADVARGNVIYRPITEALFRESLAAVDIDVSAFTFLDIGSGKGKVLFMAADLPFKRIVGVEYAAGLHEVAVRNIAAYRSSTRKCHAIEAVHADALAYPLPEGPLLLFIFNALAPPPMRELLKKLDRAAAAQPHRPLFLIYTNLRTVAELGDVFSGLQKLQVIRRMRKFVVLANAAAGTLAGDGRSRAS